MITRVEVQHDKLNRTIYNFHYIEYRHVLKLNCYLVQNRKTTRHGWESTQIYDGGSDQRSNNISVKDVIIPDDIKEKVIAEFMSKVKVEV